MLLTTSAITGSVTNNRITHFAGNGFVAEPSSGLPTIYACQITYNKIDDNGGVGILIGNGPLNQDNQVLDTDLRTTM